MMCYITWNWDGGGAGGLVLVEPDHWGGGPGLVLVVMVVSLVGYPSLKQKIYQIQPSPILLPPQPQIQVV